MEYKYEDFNEYTLEESLKILEEEIDKNNIDDNGLVEDIKDELRNQDESFNKCNELIQEIVDLLNEKKCNMICPICKEEKMTHINYKGTHIYVCEPCPFVGFELIDGKDERNVIEWLKER